ncbi:AAA family ATPase, partial [Acinetobacter pittii]|nr:AAA family ATPase [Acinetobacter pittii]
MYLKYLTITNKDVDIIRHVEFKKGINIIKGEESGEIGKNNTNSLGKTTLLRCIDFCLGGKWNAFIFDKEIKGSKNNTVFNFFKQNLPSFELLIVKNIDSNISSSLKIKRELNLNLKAKSDNSYFSIVNYINDQQVTDHYLSDTIKKFLFGFESEKPTLRQGEFKHEVRQFQKPYDNQQAEQISLM